MSLVDLLREGLTADHPFGIERTMAEAADEIERLRGDLDAMNRSCEADHAEIGRLRTALRIIGECKTLREVGDVLNQFDAVAQPT